MNRTNQMSSFNWFALQIRSRWEGDYSGAAAGKGLETLLPTYTTRRKWSDRFKVVEVALVSRIRFLPF